ncbi:WecB/TagA/CpsF family glycosyltransferase [Haloflavibacter putidus]|uniref:WecB/TagA/CpsF family glycosyltransferase n=1 Tax=Haloflavibacter putidus TaxID=2576776 RepID=A0A508A1F6_9FLAO|nr:WecB/TagA/CpsF family glycosyltransferase [Haloflavibacter putidus]TQD40765.1 WecB/TagA/CpsF family glycosyltransferase [Haloflavibacter putidus]
MAAERIKILNTYIDNLSMQETLALIDAKIQAEESLHHTVVNAGKIVAMQKDENLRKSVNEADLINADGQAVIWASKILNKPLKERVAGIDLFENLIGLAQKKKHSIYLLGAKEEVVSKLVKIIQKKYGKDVIAGFRNGYFSAEEEKKIVEDIVASNANMLFVAMSSPKKEIFLHQHRKTLKSVNFIMGVGGSFDVLSGKTKRAPLWMQKAGLEWFYRFQQEPKRMWKRYLVGNTKFITLVLKEKIKA